MTDTIEYNSFGKLFEGDTQKAVYVLETILENKGFTLTDKSMTRDSPYSPEDVHDLLLRYETMELIEFVDYDGDDVDQIAFQAADTRAFNLLYDFLWELADIYNKIELNDNHEH